MTYTCINDKNEEKTASGLQHVCVYIYTHTDTYIDIYIEIHIYVYIYIYKFAKNVNQCYTSHKMFKLVCQQQNNILSLSSFTEHHVFTSSYCRCSG